MSSSDAQEVMVDESAQPKWYDPLAAGALAGVISRLITYAPDTAKARLQIQGSGRTTVHYSGAWHAMRTIWTVEGYSGLYRGFLPVISGVLPANMAYFSGYELGRTFMQRTEANVVPQTIKDSVAGATGQLVSGVVWTPIDLVKERLQVGRVLQAAGPVEGGVTAVLHSLGNFRGLFRGYWLTNSVWLPWNMIYMAVYAETKRVLAITLRSSAKEETTSRIQTDAAPATAAPAPAPADGAGAGAGAAAANGAPCGADQQLPPWAVAVSAAIGASVGGLFTHPLDVIKTRVQVLSGPRRRRRSTGQGDRLTANQVFQDLIRREGFMTLWSGLTARLLVMAPGCAISWMTYEWAAHAIAQSRHRKDIRNSYA